MKFLRKTVYILVVLFVIRISVFKVGKDSISFDVYTILQILIVLSLLAMFLFRRNIRISKIVKIKSFKFVFVFYAIGLISYFWSALPLFSGYMALQNIVFLIAIYFLFTGPKNYEHLEKHFIQLSYILIIIDFLGDVIRFGPNIIIGYHNLETGGLAGMLLCYSLAELIRIRKKNLMPVRWKRLRNTVVISGLILVFSTSSGSNVSALAGIIAIAFLGKNYYFKFFAGLFFIMLSIFPSIIENLIQFVFPGKTMTGITSFGHRLSLWESIWELFTQRPILGWGYAAVERVGERYNVDSHNSFLGALGGLGIIGASIYILFILKFGTQIFSLRRIVGYWGVFAAFICLLVNSNTFGFLSGKTSLLTLGFFMLMAINYHYYKSLVHYGKNK